LAAAFIGAAEFIAAASYLIALLADVFARSLWRTPAGKWFAWLSADMGAVPLPLWKDCSAVDIDVCLESFSARSN
jgi:hypothetical protein